MQRAAFALSRICLDLTRRGSVVWILAGSGNNAGDALFAGAQLARRGRRVRISLASSSTHESGLSAAIAAGARVVSDAPDDCDLVLDGIVGIGGRGGLQGRAEALADRAHALGRRGAIVVAVDVPSGVDASTGAVNGSVITADLTVTFGALKQGLVVDPGARFAGHVELVDIGLGPHLERSHFMVVTPWDLGGEFREPLRDDDKYTRGVVGVVAGSESYPGAAVLCTGAARWGGAGMVRYAGRAPEAVQARWPDVVLEHRWPEVPSRVQAWAVGSGAGTDDEAQRRVLAALEDEVPVVLDADALTLLAADKELQRLVLERGRQGLATVLTPHDREFLRLDPAADLVRGDRVESVRRLADRLAATILLKGASTIVADHSGRTYVSRSGTPALATAGSGDVLTGLLGSTLAHVQARGHSAEPGLFAAVVAAQHGLAGRIAESRGPVTAVELLAAVPDMLALVSDPEEVAHAGV